MTLEFSAIAIFAGALIINAGSPGPSIAALVSRVITWSWKDVLPFAAAMWIGEAAWLGAAVFGLAVLVETLHWAFVIIKYCGVAYLLYLAWKMWFAPADIVQSQTDVQARRSPVRMFLAGLAVTMGNPKIMVFYLALLPNIVDLSALGIDGWLTLSLTLLIVLAAIDVTYIVLAGQARRLLKDPVAVKIANRVGAACIGGAAATIAAK
jgi:threonine/homoserine/homoserine lactone efflux protein